MTLYELTGQLLELYDRQFEVDDEAYKDTLEDLKWSIDQKLEGYAMVIKNLEGDELVLTDEITRLQGRKKSIELKIIRMKDTMKSAMIDAKETKIISPKFTISLANTPGKVNILNVTLIPDEYYIPQPPKLSLSQIGKELKAGKEVSGTELVKGKSLRIK